MNTIPIHLYSNKKLCILSYKKIDYLPLLKTCYVVSPNSLPLPKNIQMYYTLVSKQYPFVLQDIRKFKDPYDFDNIYKLSTKLKTQRLGIIFGLPISPSKNTVTFYESKIENNLVLTTEKNNNNNYHFFTSSLNNIVTKMSSKNIENTKNKNNTTINLVTIFLFFVVFCCIGINFIHPIFS